MNIFKPFKLFRPLYYKALNFTVIRTAIGARNPEIPTHRNEFLPFTINNLWDNPGAKKKNFKKLGRGLGTGKGKTAGKGYKGQRARAGSSVKPSFEGGQAGFHRRMPKFGCPRKNRERPIYLNLGKIVEMVKKGRLDATKLIDIKALYEANVFKKCIYGVKVLSRGIEKLDFPLNLEVTDISKRTVDIIKAAGGNATCVYRTKLLLKEHLKPEKFPIKLKDPIPTHHIVKRYEKIRERGAEVLYNEPAWVKSEKEKIGLKFLKKENLSLPKPVPDSGKDRVRIRKPMIYKTIDLKIK